jgi:hypothetical protein
VIRWHACPYADDYMLFSNVKIIIEMVPACLSGHWNLKKNVIITSIVVAASNVPY